MVAPVIGVCENWAEAGDLCEPCEPCDMLSFWYGCTKKYVSRGSVGLLLGAYQATTKWLPSLDGSETRTRLWNVAESLCPSLGLREVHWSDPGRDDCRSRLSQSKSLQGWQHLSPSAMRGSYASSSRSSEGQRQSFTQLECEQETVQTRASLHPREHVLSQTWRQNVSCLRPRKRCEEKTFPQVRSN